MGCQLAPGSPLLDDNAQKAKLYEQEAAMETLRHPHWVRLCHLLVAVSVILGLMAPVLHAAPSRAAAQSDSLSLSLLRPAV